MSLIDARANSPLRSLLASRPPIRRTLQERSSDSVTSVYASIASVTPSITLLSDAEPCVSDVTCRPSSSSLTSASESKASANDAKTLVSQLTHRQSDTCCRACQPLATSSESINVPHRGGRGEGVGSRHTGIRNATGYWLPASP
jgi:hypothetical protein